MASVKRYMTAKLELCHRRHSYGSPWVVDMRSRWHKYKMQADTTDQGEKKYFNHVWIMIDS